MDLSNYKQLEALIRRLCKGMSPDDQDDFIQDVMLKLLRTDHDGKASKAAVRKIVRQLKIDKHRKSEKSVKVIYDNELTERYHEPRE